MTVAGTTVPSVSKTWVMPTFLPMIPVTAIVVSPARRGPTPSSLRTLSALATLEASRRPTSFSLLTSNFLLVFLAKRLDLDVHARGEVELHQRVDRLRRRLEDVDQPLV